MGERSKDIVEKKAREEEEKTTEKKSRQKRKPIFALQQDKRALKGAYRSFVIPGGTKSRHRWLCCSRQTSYKSAN